MWWEEEQEEEGGVDSGTNLSSSVASRGGSGAMG